jgi:hypothetical protein
MFTRKDGENCPQRKGIFSNGEIYELVAFNKC